MSQTLSADQSSALLATLKKRFDSNEARHKNTSWEDVAGRLEKQPAKMASLFQMEDSGGEPDVVELPSADGVVFVDCSSESPKGRRSLCYDAASRESRKEHKPADSACAAAESMGVELLDEQQYRELQAFGEFDLKTSSWVSTPAEVRAKGGAIFGDRRYDRVFFYHNGAESYYAARGFRGLLKV